MSACPSIHPETGRPCEAEEHDGRTLCMATWPILMWAGFPPPPVCAAAHASGTTCGKYAHAEDERHSAHIGWGWLVWGAGLPDMTHARRTREENNARSEAEDNAAWDARHPKKDNLLWGQR